VVLPGEDFVADLNDKLVALIVEPLVRMVSRGGGLLQDGVRGNHLAGNQILAYAEMLERALSLGAPELVRRHLDNTEAVGFLSHAGHLVPGLMSLTVTSFAPAKTQLLVEARDILLIP